jgi:hypothetical protein
MSRRINSISNRFVRHSSKVERGWRDPTCRQHSTDMVGFDILSTVIPSCAGSVCENSVISKLRQN